MRSAAFAVLAVVGALVAPVATAPTVLAADAADEPAAVWLRPVDGALVKPFEEPSSVYGAGHRGADLAAAPGAAVRAANDGEVTFAGSVAGTLHVTITHLGGLRTSYSFLQSVAVRTGAVVARGDVIATTGGTNDDHHGDVLHLGLRLGDRYLDPMLLFRPVDLALVVHLAPTDAPDESPWTETDERRELTIALHLPVAGAVGDAASATASDDGGCGAGIPLVGDVVSGACDVATWIGDRAGDAVAAGLSSLHALSGVSNDVVAAIRAPVVATLDALRAVPAAFAHALARTPMGMLALDLVEMGRRFVGTVTAECSDDAAPADGTGGPGHRVMVVAGINSSGPAGDRAPTVDLDVAALGYHADEGEVRWFSYADDGGAYVAADTHGNLLDAAARLYTQLQVMQREEPGREVDLVAHSQGGVVVDAFLARYRADDPSLPPLGTVVTVSSPHEGAPIATAGEQIRGGLLGEDALDALGDLVPALPPPNGESVRQQSERSDFVRAVQRRGIPEHFEVTSIGATEDVVVPATNISLPGATETVVSVNALSEHQAVLRDADGLRAMRAALEGRAPPCVSLTTALRSAVAPVVISRVEHALGDTVSAVNGGDR